MPWPEWMGVLHGYEIPYVFGVPLRDGQNYTVAERGLARRWMKYYGNFCEDWVREIFVQDIQCSDIFLSDF